MFTRISRIISLYNRQALFAASSPLEIMSGIHERHALRVHRMPSILKSLKQQQSHSVHRMPSIPESAESAIRRTESDISAAETPGAPRQAHGEHGASAHRGSKKAQTTIAPYQRPSSPSNDDMYGMDIICCRHPASIPVGSSAASPRGVGTNNTPEWRRVRDWPAQQWPPHQEARGKLLLKCSPDDRRAARAVCSIQDGVLSLTVAIQNGQGEGSSSSVVQSPVGELAVGLRRSRTSMFILAKLVENKVCDQIYCFAENHSERNKWTAVFRRMGIPIFDVHSKRHAKAVSSGVQ